MSDPRTDDDLNRIIAEWCGWVRVMKSDGTIYWLSPTDYYHEIVGKVIKVYPNYCRDLNAVQGVVSTFKDGDLIRYVNVLWGVCTPNPSVSLIHVIEAKARQRAEALLKVIEEWKNKPPHHLEPELIGRNGNPPGDI